ncbi:hypothetical protein [Klebsiella quasipneumoniae]|uniref:hypothetical protein n=1 Tax=Klebsiella quasipneumoniae TaxID=1463165 RepID=UPI0021099717|nr:hypothetical protein [Klebsiella quasipneumoniae]
MSLKEIHTYITLHQIHIIILVNVNNIKIKLMMIATVSLITLSGCSSDPTSMWNSRYNFKSVGQVMEMCNSGDKDACIAAGQMGTFVNGMNGLNAVTQQGIQQQQQQPQHTMTTTTCNRLGTGVICNSN